MHREVDADGKGCLALDYFVRPEPDAVAPAVWKKVPWKLGSGVYQNCDLESFTVSQLKEKGTGGKTSCLKIVLKIKNPLTGDAHSFQMQRAVDCYNLASENIDEVLS